MSSAENFELIVTPFGSDIAVISAPSAVRIRRELCDKDRFRLVITEIFRVRVGSQSSRNAKLVKEPRLEASAGSIVYLLPTFSNAYTDVVLDTWSWLSLNNLECGALHLKNLPIPVSSVSSTNSAAFNVSQRIGPLSCANSWSARQTIPYLSS